MLWRRIIIATTLMLSRAIQAYVHVIVVINFSRHYDAEHILVFWAIVFVLLFDAAKMLLSHCVH